MAESAIRGLMSEVLANQGEVPFEAMRLITKITSLEKEYCQVFLEMVTAEVVREVKDKCYECVFIQLLQAIFNAARHREFRRQMKQNGIFSFLV